MMIWTRWVIGVSLGVALAQTYGLFWFFVGPVSAFVLALMDLGYSEVRRA